MDSRKPLTVDMTDSEFLSWVADRLEFQHGDSHNVDFLHRLRKIAASIPPPPDAAVREAVRMVSEQSRYTTNNGYSLVHTENVRLLLRAVQAPRLTVEQLEAVKNAEAALSMQTCLCADGFICTRCQGLCGLRAAFPELAEAPTTWTCGICGEKRPDCVKPVQDEECGDACPEHYEAGEVGCG